MNLAPLIWNTSRVRLLEILQTEDLNELEISIVIATYNGRGSEEPDETLQYVNRPPRRGESFLLDASLVSPASSRFFVKHYLRSRRYSDDADVADWGSYQMESLTVSHFRHMAVQVDFRTWTIFDKWNGVWRFSRETDVPRRR